MKTWFVFLAILAAIGALTVADAIRTLNRPSIRRYAFDEKENEHLANLANAYRAGGRGAQKEQSVTMTCGQLQKPMLLNLCWEGFAVQKFLKVRRPKDPPFDPPPQAEMAQAWYTGLGSAFSIAGLAANDERAPGGKEFSWFAQGWAFDEFLRHGFPDAYMKCFTEFSLQQRPDCTLGIGRGTYFSRAHLMKISALPDDVSAAFRKAQLRFQ